MSIIEQIKALTPYKAAKQIQAELLTYGLQVGIEPREDTIGHYVATAYPRETFDRTIEILWAMGFVVTRSWWAAISIDFRERVESEIGIHAPTNTL